MLPVHFHVSLTQQYQGSVYDARLPSFNFGGQDVDMTRIDFQVSVL